MNSVASLNALLASAYSLIDQTPPPTLREILGAYKSKGDGDRDMLLAMLNAKSAEDQRLASVAALHRSILEVHQSPSRLHTEPSLYFPPPAFTQSPHRKQYRQVHPPRPQSSSRSPPHPSTSLPPIHDSPPPSSQPPRKRHRSSLSSTASSHPTTSRRDSHPSPVPDHQLLPPSPYSSAASDSASYSPRSRASMAIGSLLSTGPDREPDDPSHPSADRCRPPRNASSSAP